MADSISNGSENEEVTDQFSLFKLRKASAHRQSPSRSLEALVGGLVGEHVQRQTQLTPESAPLCSLLHRHFSLGTVLPKSFTGEVSSNSRLDVREVKTESVRALRRYFGIKFLSLEIR